MVSCHFKMPYLRNRNLDLNKIFSFSFCGLRAITFKWENYLFFIIRITLKEPGFLDPSHRRGGRIPPPLSISETDWWTIMCVVPMDSYDPPESIHTKKSTNIPCMTSQWRQTWRNAKMRKISKNRQIHGFSPFFQAKVGFFGHDVCQSMRTHALTTNKSNK